MQDEKGHAPLSDILVPDRALPQLVLVVFVEHDLDNLFIELDVFLLHANDVHQLVL